MKSISLHKLFLAFFLPFLFFLGGGNYLVQSYFDISSPSHFFMLGSLIFCLVFLLNNSGLLDFKNLMGCLIIFLWFSLSGISYITQGGGGVQFQIIMLLVLWIGICIAFKKRGGAEWVGIVFFAQIFLQAFFCYSQVSFLENGTGMRPNYDQDGLILVTGSFNNPNDLACVVFSSFIALVFFGFNKINKVMMAAFSALTIFVVFIALSRTVVVLLFLFFIVWALRAQRLRKDLWPKIFLVFIFLAIFFLGWGVINNPVLMDVEGFSVISRSLDRFLSLQTLKEDDSVDLRIKTLFYFIENLNEIGFSVGVEGDYRGFFKNADFESSLISLNPHSFIIEMAVWLGVWGGGIALAWILVILLPLFRSPRIDTKEAIFLSFCLALLMTVPSSVLGNSYFWVPWIYMSIAAASKDAPVSRIN